MATDWIKASEAIKLVSDASNPFAAPRAICSRAHAGLVAARARLLVIGGKEASDAEVPKEFWWARGEVALDQNWTTGDFETWYDRQVHCLAYGVEFLRIHIEEMLPNKASGRSAPQWEPGNYIAASVCLAELKQSLGLSTSEVEATILQHCRAGLVPSRCSELWSRLTTRYGEESPELEENVAIPDWVWEHCLDRPEAVLNWSADVFAGEGHIDGDDLKVKVTGIEFEASAIIAIERFVLNSREADGGKAADVVSNPQSAKPGRRLSKLWPGWVAELAATIHEKGIPEGEGSQGQEELIRRVADALAERGLEGPSRTTVQPVVQAVLDRIRAAGN